MGTQHLVFFRSPKSRLRFTNRSRRIGNLLIGSSVIAWPLSVSLSTRAEQLWRTLPLMTMVHAPQTSSRQPLSHTGGVVCCPEVVTGLAAIAWRHEMMFMLGRYGTANSSQRDAALGPSWRRMRMVIFRSVSVEAMCSLG